LPNTSATGGYLDTALGTDKPLRAFFQTMIKSITGIDGSLVRPRWQPNPPKQPSNETNWCAFGFDSVKSDHGAYVKTALNGLGSTLSRHEDVFLSAAFYGPNCYSFASLLRDGLEIQQNRDVLKQNGVAYLYEEGITHNPELINDIWFDRQDLKLKFNREINREYAILSFVDASGIIVTDNAPPLTRVFNASQAVR
jgi:hypothetical protein